MDKDLAEQIFFFLVGILKERAMICFS